MGPALLFSTATGISVLGWDGKVRTILSISMPNAGRNRRLLMLVLLNICVIECSIGLSVIAIHFSTITVLPF